jgi:anti-sigma-K factor RskA
VTARDDKLRESAAAYALGALGSEEAREFEKLLAVSPEARAELAGYREAIGVLPLAADVPGPDPALRGRVIARATGRAKRQPRAGRRRGDRLLRAGLAASAVLALGTSALAVVSIRAREEMASRADSARAGVAALEHRLAGRERLLGSLLDPASTVLRLSATSQPSPDVQLIWNREREVAVLHASELPIPPPDRAWQLWLIPEGGAPVPSSVFRTEADGRALVEDIRLPTDGRRWAAFALTEEPAGGSRAPTSAPRYLATIAS